MSQHVKIDISQPGRALVYVDGVQITHINALRLDLQAGGRLAQVELTLLPDTVEVTGLADVVEKHAVLKA